MDNKNFDHEAYSIGLFIKCIAGKECVPDILMKIFNLMPKDNDITRELQLIKMLAAHRNDSPAGGVKSDPFTNGIYMSAEELSQYDRSDVEILHLMTEQIRKGGHAKDWDSIMSVYDEEADFLERFHQLPVTLQERLKEEIERLSVVHRNSLDDVTMGDFSDGYHTFNDLYKHRTTLFSCIWNMFPDMGFRDREHHDKAFPMYDGMFIAGLETPYGQVSYHCDNEYWGQFDPARDVPGAPEFDGHTSEDVLRRLRTLCGPNSDYKVVPCKGAATQVPEDTIKANAVLSTCFTWSLLSTLNSKTMPIDTWEVITKCLCENNVPLHIAEKCLIEKMSKVAPNSALWGNMEDAFIQKLRDAYAWWKKAHGYGEIDEQ
ncbi:MAG: hypothetical protein K2F99_05345 [Muribaculaceae bacterium]|nr:hypothetical protein [Muribaculaceae bacterium]